MSAPTKIFYADDDTDDLAFFKEATDAAGKDVQLFELGEELLHAMKNPPPSPSLVFLDLNMPGKSGFDILKEIRDSVAFREIPVIILSTASDQKSVQKSQMLGADYYVCKPNTLAGLKKVIQHVVDIDWKTQNASTSDFVYKP